MGKENLSDPRLAWAQYVLIGVDCTYASAVMLFLIGGIWMFTNLGPVEGIAFLAGVAVLEHFLLRKVVFLPLRRSILRRTGKDAIALDNVDRLGLLSIDLRTDGQGDARSSLVLGIVKIYVIAVFAVASLVGIQSGTAFSSALRGIQAFTSVWLIGMSGYAIIAIYALIRGRKCSL
jgi:hypothetical protein